MYKITTSKRLFLIGNMQDILYFLAQISKTNVSLKQYLEDQPTLL